MIVFLTVLLILVAALWGPISNHLEKYSLTRAVEAARTLNTVLFQYANDNNGVYPVGAGTPAAGKSEGVARNLLENTYVPDASFFAVGATERYAGKATDFSDLAASNVSWDFTAGATTTTGLTTDAPDSLPTLYTTGESVTYPTTGAGLDLTISGNGPFGSAGVVVAYKGGNAAFKEKGAVFIPAASGVCPGFISTDLKSAGPYTQIKP